LTLSLQPVIHVVAVLAIAGAESVNNNESSWAVGPPTQHENQLPSGDRGSGSVALSWYDESAMSLTRELSAPRIVAFEHAEQSRA
jgi:hypothetical protein